MKHVYPHYGLPLGLVSDRGSQWNSALFRDMCDDLGIDLKLTFSYHPQANGQVERYNRVIEEAVRTCWT
jgi:transposase InsO family protein